MNVNVNIILILHNTISTHNTQHSMGCLITLAALHTKPSLFHSVLFCGGNFGGGAGFYPTNTEGMTVGLNKQYLSGEVCHTFPSMYAVASPMGIGNDPILLCDDGNGYVNDGCANGDNGNGRGKGTGKQLFQFIDSESFLKGGGNGDNNVNNVNGSDGEDGDNNNRNGNGHGNCNFNADGRVVDIDMYDINDWKHFKLGPYSLKGPVSPEMEEHVKICLKLGKVFQHKMRNITAATTAVDDNDTDHDNKKSDNDDCNETNPNPNPNPNEATKQYPPTAVLVGDQYLNPDIFLWDVKASRWIEWDDKSLRRFKPKNLVRTDGTVSYISASRPPLPRGVTVREYKARNNGPGVGSHRELMNDVEMIDIILNDLRHCACRV